MRGEGEYRLGRHRGKFVVRFTDEDGVPRRHSLGTDDAAEARAALGEYIDSRERLTRPGRMTVAAILGAYEADRAGTFFRILRFRHYPI